MRCRYASEQVKFHSHGPHNPLGSPNASLPRPHDPLPVALERPHPPQLPLRRRRLPPVPREVVSTRTHPLQPHHPRRQRRRQAQAQRRRQPHQAAHLEARAGRGSTAAGNFERAEGPGDSGYGACHPVRCGHLIQAPATQPSQPNKNIIHESHSFHKPPMLTSHASSSAPTDRAAAAAVASASVRGSRSAARLADRPRRRAARASRGGVPGARWGGPPHEGGSGSKARDGARCRAWAARRIALESAKGERGCAGAMVGL